VIARLGDVCEIQSGGTPARSNLSYWEGGTIPWVKISDIKGEYLQITEEFITEEGLQNSSAKIFPKGTILYTIFATLGETCILDIDAATNQAIAGITIKSDNVYREYLYYYLVSLKSAVNRLGRGVAQNNINMGILRNLPIPLPPLDEQRKIAAVLDKVSDLIAKRRQQLDKLEELVRSRFVEMFGDMSHNPYNWPTHHLEEIADIVSGITKGRKTKEQDLIEVPYMAVSNVKDGYIDWTTVKSILATQSEIKQYHLLPDDILMTEGGDPDKLGRGAIIQNPPKNCIHQNHIFRVRLNETILLPSYFAEFLKHQKAKQYFLRCAKQTTGIASINMRQLKGLPTLLPPVDLQNQFATFVEQTEKIKTAISRSLDKLETLKMALMQEYFG
jgi:type I restriction enzyme S subunit